MLAVYDNALSTSEINELINRYHGSGKSLPTSWVPSQRIDACEKAIVELAQKFHGFNDFAGVEIWTHNDTRPGEHKDKDEVLFNRTGEEQFPLCSIVVYLAIEDLVAGEFNCGGVRIKPRSNRIVTFAPGLLHNVNDFCGKRFMLAINPWLNCPEGYDV
jgi:hypothetical protein